MSELHPETKDAAEASQATASVATPVKSAAPPVASKGFSFTPRNLMLCALALSFLALFGKYQWGVYNFTAVGPFVDISVPIPQTATGFQLKPHAAFIIVGLAFVFGTSLREHPFLRRWGYWLAVLLLAFATCNGFLSFGAFVLACVAAYLHAKELKKQTAA